MATLKRVLGALKRGTGTVLKDTFRSNHEVIRSQEELPAPETRNIDNQDIEVIPLETGVEYEFNGVVSHDYPILGNGQQLQGGNWAGDILNYTGSDRQLIWRDNAFFMKNMSLMASSGQVFDLDADNNTDFLTQDCAVLSANNLGVVDGYEVPAFKDFSFAGYNGGLTFLGSPIKIFIHACPFRNPGGGTSAIKLDGDNGLSAELVHIEAPFFESFNANDDVLEVTGNPVTNFATFSTATSQFDLNDRLVGVSRSEPQWQFLGNSDVADSSVTGVADLSGTHTQSITAGDGDDTNPTKIDGTTTGGDLERFTHSNGTLTYSGVKDRKVKVSLNVTMQSTGGGEVDVTVYVGKNGSESQVGSQTVTLGSGGESRSARAEAFLDVSDGDDVEAFVENDTDTSDIQFNDYDLIVGKA